MTSATPNPSPRERGFLMLTVLVMIGFMVTMVGWGLSRATLRSAIVDERIDSYRTHHEREGLRSLSLRWLRDAETQGVLDLLAEDGGVAYRAELPNDSVVTMRVMPAQGTIYARVGAAGFELVEEMLIDALRQLPPDRPDLVRAYGPVRTDIRVAPREVLNALAGGDPGVASVLEDLAEDPPPDRGQLLTQMLARGVDNDQARELVRIIDVRASLWLIEADVFDRLGQRRYHLLSGMTGNEATVFEIDRVPVAEAGDGQTPRGYGAAGRR